MGSDFDSFHESPLGAFMQSSLGERGGPQGLVRLIGKNAGGGQIGDAIHTSGSKSYILGAGENSAAGMVLLKYTRPTSPTDLGPHDWQKKIDFLRNKRGVIAAPDGDVFFAGDEVGIGGGDPHRFTIGVFAGTDGATQSLKDISPDTATGTDSAASRSRERCWM